MSEKIVILGHLGAPYGVKGWLHIRSHTHPDTNLFAYQDWLIGRSGQWQPTKLLNWRGAPKRWVVQILGCDNREAAALITQCPVGIYRDQLEPLPKDQFYWTDLENLEVWDQEKDLFLGHVYTLKAMPTYDSLIVKRPDASGASFTIPFILEDTVVRVDLARQRIWVRYVTT